MEHANLGNSVFEVSQMKEIILGKLVISPILKESRIRFNFSVWTSMAHNVRNPIDHPILNVMYSIAESLIKVTK